MFGRLTGCALLVLCGISSLLAAEKASNELRRLAKAALSPTPEAADPAVAQLRELGPQALNFLLAARQRLLTQKAMPNTDRLDQMIDRVAGQRYGHLSGLFWHTDLAKAQAAALASGKPILSLRMLGNLTDEYSCANSRFFRTTLYCNPTIAKELNEHFVLHWQSVRPVPRVTIDFGDGRKLERTLTGNSAHYVLAADGTPLDVLPGLYGPERFTQWLGDMRGLHDRTHSLAQADRIRLVQQYHVQRGKELTVAWNRDLAKVPEIRTSDASQLTDRQWQQLAMLPEHAIHLDPVSREVIRRENPGAAQAGKRAMTKRAVEDPILALVRTLQNSIGLDSVRNEYTLHRQAHAWFASGQVPHDIAALNERVYTELFLTPSSDPWLGLADDATYTALKNAGVVTTQTAGR